MRVVPKGIIGRGFFRVLRVSKKNLLEDLSAIEHDQWVEWSKAIQTEVSDKRKARWKKYWVPYKDLPDDVKEQDREYAKKVLEIIEE